MGVCFNQRVLGFSALCVMASSAIADDFMDLSLGELTSIKVEVASLFLDDSLDVASSTAIISAQDWQDRGVSTLGQALEMVPSVFSNTTWGGSEVLAIRGYSTELSVRGIAYSLEQIPLGSYVYANTGYFLPRMPLNLLQQVEMIRGTGSALYGTDAFHGVLSFKLAQSKTDKVQSYAQLGSPDHQQVAVTSSKYLDSWQVHSGFAYEQDGGHDLAFSYTDPINGDTEHSSRDQQFQNLSAFVNASRGNENDGKLSLLYFHNQYESQDFTGIGQQFFKSLGSKFDLQSSSIAQQGDVTGSDTQLDMLGVRYEFKTQHDLIIKNQIHGWQSKHEWSFDNTQYPDSLTLLPAFSGATLPCKVNQDSTSPNPLYCSHMLYQGADEQRIGYSLQIKNEQNSWNTQWVLGAGYDELTVLDSRFERIAPNGNSINYIDNAYNNKTRRMTHLMAQARSGFLNDTLLFTYGLRWDDYSDASDHASPRLGLVHKINERWRQKLLYGHAYRAPTAIEIYGSSSSVLGDENIQPETIDSYEYVLILSTPHYEIETVVFQSHWQDAIALVPVSPGSTTNQYQNIKENESQGIELSFRRQHGTWSGQGNLSYVESKNIDENESYYAFPSIMATINSEYEMPALKLRMGVWFRFMDDYELTDSDLTVSNKKQYRRLDTYAKWGISQQTELGLSIQNLTDRSNILPSYYSSENGLADTGLLLKATFKHNF